MDTKNIRIDDFDYPLPDERIAKHPLAKRDACKLLVARVGDKKYTDAVFADLPDFLPEDAILVANNTRVIKARIVMHKPGGARIEIFCLEPEQPADYERNFGAKGHCSWQCLVGNSKRWKEGQLSLALTDASGNQVILTATRSENPQIIDFSWTPENLSFSEVIALAGEIPIPPYLNRASEESDANDYQTVYSSIEGSVAAPTAGLHFTPELLADIDAKGFTREEVTLHVGAGTFKPVKSDTIGEHDMHSEFISVHRRVIEKILDAGFKNIIAVGTTSVRTLESLYHIGCLMAQGRWNGELGQWEAYSTSENEITPEQAFSAILRHLNNSGEDRLMARTRIIIAPGYVYRVVSGMVTNFHHPKSTLLLLVSAFFGGEQWRDIYSHALASNYRFLSYGDACLFLKQ